jgi:CheY-like chemotaxis protein
MLPVSASLTNPTPIPSVQMAVSRSRTRVVLIASSDSSLRERLRRSLAGLRWQVLEAPGGAEAWMASRSATQLEALLIDPWLPDLDVSEFLQDFHLEYPQVDLMMTDGAAVIESIRSPYHQELLYALRRSQDEDTAAWRAAPSFNKGGDLSRLPDLLSDQLSDTLSDLPLNGLNRSLPHSRETGILGGQTHLARIPGYQVPVRGEGAPVGRAPEPAAETAEGLGKDPDGWQAAGLAAAGNGKAILYAVTRRETTAVERIPELIGSSPAMLEVSRRIRLVAAANRHLC